MTFGYNSHFSSVSHSRENILNISDFAKDLLFSMKFATGEGEGRLDIGSAPIIFVAHSMGGLIVKKAFILGQHDEHYRELIRAVSGIIFLSTPHRGSDLADVLNKILSACIFAFSPKQYISELSINSPTLQEINEQFRNLAPKVSLVSFFETLKTAIGPSQVMVLQKDSSILGYPGEISKPLDADHHDVCKYTSQQDPNYISVRNILKYLVGKHHSRDLPKIESNSVDELYEIASAFGRIEGPADDLIFFSDRRMPGSCEWIDEDPGFTSFLADEIQEPRCLWCTGRPGSGKSVLASSIIQTAQESDFDSIFFFFRFGDQVKNNLNTLLLSLAYQIAGTLPEYRRRLLRLFDDGLNVQKSAPRLLWQKLFISTFFKLSLARPLLIVIDGLDECDSSSLFLNFLEDFHAFSGSIRILVLSRSTQSLSSGFEKLSKRLQVRYHPLENMKEDLRMYVEEEMATMHGDEEFKYAIATQLVRKADGNFLWANLVLTEVLRCHTQDAVLEALEDVPEELEPLYERMDSTLAKSCRPSDRAMGKTILIWTACSRHPLNLLNLAEALQPEYANILDLGYTISRVCGEFVVVDSKGVVSIVHSSARDCLFQNSSLNYHISRESSHQFIFTKCVTALINASPRIQAGQMKSQAFLLYASTSWPFHLELGSEFSDQNSLLLLARFFQSSAVLGWVYLLSVAGQLRVLVQASRKMASFLKKIDRLDEARSPLTHRLREKEHLALWNIDLIRLVGKFGSHLNDQPKLIFKLVAPFCPQDSMIFKQFSTRSTGSSVSISGFSNTSWDDCLAKFAVHASKVPLQIQCANRYFAILLSDGTVLLYHASTCEDARHFHHGERVLTWCFNHIGDRLVTCGLTKTIVWVTATGQQLFSFANPRRSKAITIAFANADESLVTCCDDRVIRSLSLNMRDEGWQVKEEVLGEDTFEGKQCGSPRCASFNPSASQIAITYRAIPLTVWSIDEPRPFLVGRCQRVLGGRQVPSSGASDVQGITWNPMTGHVLGRYNDGCVFKWHPFEGDYQESSISVGRIECSPDGKFFVTSSRDGTLRIWDFYHLTPIYQLSCSAPVTSLAIDPNDTRIYDIRESFCSVWEPNALVRMWETEDKSSETMSTRESTQVSHVSDATFETLQPITTLAVESESLSYATGNDDGLVTHFTKEGTTASELIQTFMTVEHVCWSDDGRYVAASGLERRIFVKEVDQAKPSQMSKSIMTGKEEDPIRQISLSPTGSFLLVATDRFLNIWSTHKKQVVLTRPQVTLHRWFNYPSDGMKVIGFCFAGIQIIDWQEATSIRRLTLDRSLVDSTTNQTPHDWLHRTPSAQYPMSPTETDEVVDKILLTVDGTTSLTVTSQSTIQGRRERQYMLVNLASMTSSLCTIVTATALPRDLQAHIAIPLGFLAADASLATRRKSTLQHITTPNPTGTASPPPIMATPRATDHVLAFLDHEFWVCTYTLSETRPGRVKRHFFLPRDWLNLTSLELAVMRTDGVLLCPRNGEVALVENGLREEWLE
jgi:WD40 repeat protein